MFTPGGPLASEASQSIVPLPRVPTPGGCAMLFPAASVSPWRARGEAWHLPLYSVGLFSNLVSISFVQSTPLCPTFSVLGCQEVSRAILSI